MLLELKNIEAAYGNIKALKGINLAVPEGKIVTLIGANGAGKSTTMKTIMGVMKPIAGDVLFKGESIAGKKTYDIVNSGVVLVPEGRQILQGMTATSRTCWNIVSPVGALDVERHILEILHLRMEAFRLMRVLETDDFSYFFHESYFFI